MEDTIEERIFALQEKKLDLYKGTIDGDSGSLGKLSADDMRFLFA